MMRNTYLKKRSSLTAAPPAGLSSLIFVSPRHCLEYDVLSETEIVPQLLSYMKSNGRVKLK